VTIRTLPVCLSVLLDEAPRLKQSVTVTMHAHRHSIVDLAEESRRGIAKRFAEELVKVLPMEPDARVHQPDPFGRSLGSPWDAVTYSVTAHVLGRAELAVLLTRAYELGRAAR
jgi:hypothetical protein